MEFAANLSFRFQELDFTDRFAAARKAGFSAVEMLFPYDPPPATLKTLVADNELILALFNLPPGNWQAGDRGMAAIPGRQGEFAASVEQALDWALELGVTRLHMMAGNADPRDPDCARDLSRKLAPCGPPHLSARHRDHDRAHQRPRHAGLFPQ